MTIELYERTPERRVQTKIGWLGGPAAAEAVAHELMPVSHKTHRVVEAVRVARGGDACFPVLLQW